MNSSIVMFPMPGALRSSHALANEARTAWLERGISATPDLGLRALREVFTLLTDDIGDL